MIRGTEAAVVAARKAKGGAIKNKTKTVKVRAADTREATRSERILTARGFI